MSLDPTAIPAHVGTDTTPGDLTFYFTIDLHNGLPTSKSKTAVYLPDSMQAGLDVTLILYLQGYTQGLSPIDVFLKDPDFKLREQIHASSKGAFIFVAPTLLGVLSSQGYKSAMPGDLVKEPGNYLRQVMNGLFEHGPFGSVPRVSQIILAAHSAGGQWLLPIASHPAVQDLIREVWCFDCLYYGGDWISWIKGRKQLKRFWAYSMGGGTLSNTRAIRDQARAASLTNVEATATGAWQGIVPDHHDRVPKAFFTKLVDTSRVLS